MGKNECCACLPVLPQVYQWCVCATQVCNVCVHLEDQMGTQCMYNDSILRDTINAQKAWYTAYCIFLCTTHTFMYSIHLPRQLRMLQTLNLSDVGTITLTHKHCHMHMHSIQFISSPCDGVQVHVRNNASVCTIVSSKLYKKKHSRMGVAEIEF